MAKATEKNITKATEQNINEMITDDEEAKEILIDLINGDYTLEALRSDFEEWIEESS